MSTTPFQARLALAGFLAVGAGTAVNILYFQDPAVVSGTAKQKTERAAQRAEADRRRRLALDPKEAAPAATGQARSKLEPARIAAVLREAPEAPPAATSSAQTGRVGRFAPSGGQFERTAATVAIATAVPEPELRMPEIVKAIQTHLGRRGYEPGTPDGVVGVITRAAIMAYEHDQGLPLTGEPSEQVLQHLQGLPASRPASAHGRSATRSPNADQIIRTVQQTLAQLGYFTGKIDGHSGEETVRAIREYEMDVGLVPSGRISAPLLLKLAGSTTSKSAAR